MRGCDTISTIMIYRYATAVVVEVIQWNHCWLCACALSESATRAKSRRSPRTLTCPQSAVSGCESSDTGVRGEGYGPRMGWRAAHLGRENQPGHTGTKPENARALECRTSHTALRPRSAPLRTPERAFAHPGARLCETTGERTRRSHTNALPMPAHHNTPSPGSAANYGNGMCQTCVVHMSDACYFHGSAFFFPLVQKAGHQPRKISWMMRWRRSR